MMAILYERVHIAKAVNATVIGIEDAPRGYAEFDQGASRKYVLNPHGALDGLQPSDVTDAGSCRRGGPRTRGPFLAVRQS